MLRHDDNPQSHEKPVDSHSIAEPSDLGRNILQLFQDDSNPHSHVSGYSEKLLGVLEKISKLRLGEDMEGASTFFKQARYVFKEDSKYPVVVMKSLEELDEDRDTRKSKYRSRCNESLLATIREGLKKSKKGSQVPRIEGQSKAVDDDIDIFGGMSLPNQSNARQASEMAGKLFSQNDQQEEDIESSNRRIQEALRIREEHRIKPEIPSTAGEDFFPEVSEFGQKLDISKYREDKSSSVSKKQKTDKQLFSQVMKKMEKLDK